MRMLVLGRGKTGSTVAEVARERGHTVDALGGAENPGGAALTAQLVGGYDVVVDFTTPDAVVANLEHLLPHGARVVVGTTGWYAELPRLAELATAHHAALLHGTNFSVGVQAFFQAARALAQALGHYEFAITEVHHVSKRDAPSGTALTLQQVVQAALPAGAPRVDIVSRREGDVAGLHRLEARSGHDRVVLEHDAYGRRGFAEGAVRAAEWLAAEARPRGAYDFSAVAPALG